jgi:PAS domain S-box-containing protein
MRSNTRRVFLLTTLALYSLLVFILDVISPVGIEVWVLNLPVILVPVLFRNPRGVVFLSLACSVMVSLGSIFSPLGNNPLWWDVLNRGMGLTAMWLIAALAITVIKRSTQLDEALNSLRREMAEHDLTRGALEQNEERLRLAMEGAGMGTFDLTVATGKVVCSETHLRLVGFEPVPGGEIPVDQWRSCIHPDDQERIQEAREQALHHRLPFSCEYRIHRADTGELVWLAVFGRFHYDPTGKAVRFVGVSFDVTRRKELEHEVLAIAAREQRQIGQELHDSVGQELTGLGLMAHSLAQRLPDAAVEKPIARRLVAGLDAVHQKVRELSRGLIPVHVESRGLSAALDDLAVRTTEASGISVTAECPEWIELPDHATATELFRIAQEAVGNALRHGRPRHVRLTLLPEPNGLRLRIKDDGVGIQTGPDKRDGLGLRIMRYRAGLIGGILQITPSQEGGTVVTCTLLRRKGHVKGEMGSGRAQGEGLDRG